jgi:hypothetical protein
MKRDEVAGFVAPASLPAAPRANDVPNGKSARIPVEVVKVFDDSTIPGGDSVAKTDAETIGASSVMVAGNGESTWNSVLSIARSALAELNFGLLPFEGTAAAILMTHAIASAITNTIIEDRKSFIIFMNLNCWIKF